MPVKLTPKGEGLASKPAWERRGRRVGNHAERHDDGRVAGFGGDGGAVGAREQQGVQVVGFHDFVDAVGAG